MNKPIFVKLYEDYKKYIRLGVYQPGDKLPSVRDVASKEGVNPHTVNRAFLMLENEGYIETVFKKGSFVKTIDLESELLTQIKEDIKNWKKQGIPQQDLENYIKKVYGNNDD